MKGVVDKSRFGWIVSLALSCTLAGTSASAVVVELKDVAPDRIERQQKEAVGQLPLPGTPNLAQFPERLKEKGLTLGSDVFIRVFKAESELEVWMRRGETFVLFATYPICHWSGTIGPKISEGDKQTPEGIYTVTQKQLHMIGRHPRSLNLGFPNAYDKQYQRTGSYILIHGGCSTVGCIAMTNPVIEEIFSLAQSALKNGQDAVQVHVFPFRMTEERLKAYALNDWYDFWRNLKDAYDSFERRRLPPKVSVCDGRYLIEDSASVEEVASHGPLAFCGARPVGVALPTGRRADAATMPSQIPQWKPVAVRHPSRQPSSTSARTWVLPRSTPAQSQEGSLASDQRMALASSGAESGLSRLSLPSQQSQPTGIVTGARPASGSGRKTVLQAGLRQASLPTTDGTTRRDRISCNPSLSSCRKFIALQQAAAARRLQEARAAAVQQRREARSPRSGGRGS